MKRERVGDIGLELALLVDRQLRAHLAAPTPGKDRRRGEVRAKLTINEERKLEADAPPGSRFKGYESFVVQDLVLRPR